MNLSKALCDVAGVFALALSVCFLTGGSDSPLRVELQDSNQDGRPDTEIGYNEGRRVYQARDLDFDGRMDYWSYFKDSGVLQRSGADRNKDGLEDSWKFFERGRQVVLFENDRNYDGKVDDRKLMIWEYSRRENRWRYRPEWIERDSDFDGRIDEHWIRGRPAEETSKRLGEPLPPFFKTGDLREPETSPKVGAARAVKR